MNNTQTSLKSVVTTFSDIQQKTGVSSNLMGMFGFNLMNKLQKEMEGKQLKGLTFDSCKINKPTSQKFVLKNLSGIKTKFDFGSLAYEPLSHVAPSEKSEIQKALEEQEAAAAKALDSPGKEKKQLRFADTTKTSNMTMRQTTMGDKKRIKAILSDEHEQT